MMMLYKVGTWSNAFLINTGILKVMDTVYLLIFMKKILPSFSSCRIQACMCLTLPLKKVALACNSCPGRVGRAGNLIVVPVVNSPHMKY